MQGGGFDRVTGIVSARNGDTLTVEDGTLVANDGIETFLGGTTFVIVGPNTLVTVFGQGVAEINTPQQIIGGFLDRRLRRCHQSLGGECDSGCQRRPCAPRY